MGGVICNRRAVVPNVSFVAEFSLFCGVGCGTRETSTFQASRYVAEMQRASRPLKLNGLRHRKDAMSDPR
jgi:hypothetical protein